MCPEGQGGALANPRWPSENPKEPIFWMRRGLPPTQPKRSSLWRTRRRRRRREVILNVRILEGTIRPCEGIQNLGDSYIWRRYQSIEALRHHEVLFFSLFLLRVATLNVADTFSNYIATRSLNNTPIVLSSPSFRVEATIGLERVFRSFPCVVSALSGYERRYFLHRNPQC